jgi:hypothetical protein
VRRSAAPGRPPGIGFRHFLAAPLLLILTTGAGCMTLAPRSRPVSSAAIVFEDVPVREFGPERCGAGSLSAVLTFYGEPVTVEELDARLPKSPGGGVLSVDLLLAARELGHEARWVTGDETLLREVVLGGRPAILMLRVLNAPGSGVDYYHYVVVDGIDPERELLRFQFGDGKARWSRLGRGMRRAWRGGGNAMLLVGPRDPGAAVAERLRRAVDLETGGRLREAEDEYGEILAAHPEVVRAWVNLGNVRAKLGDADAAEAAFRQALEIDPESTDALNNLAWLFLDNGERLVEAENLARLAATREGPDRDLVLDTLGRVLLAQGRCGEAAGTFRQALGLTPIDRSSDRAHLLEGLARAHEQCEKGASP